MYHRHRVWAEHSVVDRNDPRGMVVVGLTLPHKIHQPSTVWVVTNWWDNKTMLGKWHPHYSLAHKIESLDTPDTDLQKWHS